MRGGRVARWRGGAGGGGEGRDARAFLRASLRVRVRAFGGGGGGGGGAPRAATASARRLLRRHRRAALGRRRRTRFQSLAGGDLTDLSGWRLPASLEEHHTAPAVYRAARR